jgi:hypothetical protein
LRPHAAISFGGEISSSRIFRIVSTDDGLGIARGSGRRYSWTRKLRRSPNSLRTGAGI